MTRARGTAEFTTFGRAAGALDRDPVLRNPDDLAESLLGWRMRLLVRLCRVPAILRAVDRAYERTSPGAARYLLARTRHFDEITRTAIAAGATQLVLLGAGYDTRPYRLDLPGVAVFELDHPDTSRRKQELLARRPGGPPTHVTFVAIDLDAESLAARLLATSYDPGARTLFLWEGVSYYLAPASVDAVLAFVARHAGAGSSIAFDYLHSGVMDGSSEAYGVRQIRRMVARMGEPFRFGITAGTVGEFVRARGLELVSDVDPEELERRYLRDASGATRGRVSGFFGIAEARVPTRP